VSRIDHTRLLNPGDDEQGLIAIAWAIERQTVPMSRLRYSFRSPQAPSATHCGEAFPGMKWLPKTNDL